jgi:outer membrane receptor protein involved in Fe transport
MTNRSDVFGRAGRRSALLNGARIIGLAGLSMAAANVALAQEAAPAGEDEMIVVTGTRIQRPDFEFSNPVVSTTAEEISNSGQTNLLDYLQTVPSLNNSLNAIEGFPSAGLSGIDLLNLRNLGTNRTLVLVDGKRHVPGLGGSGSVDVSSIPTDLVERVDVLTGGASAIYGADGVSGVVNFIMRDDFEGARFRVEAGAPSEEGQETQFASATWGANIGTQGNIAASIEYSNETLLRCRQRSFCADEVRFVTNPDTTVYGPYSRIPLDNLVWFSSGRGGAVDTDGDIFFANFDGNTDAAWNYGTHFLPTEDIYNGGYDIGFTYGQGGSGTRTAAYTETMVPAVERVNVNLFGHYDFSDAAQFYSQLKFVRSTADDPLQPTFDYGYAISLDNPYIPTNIRADAVTNGQDAVYVTRDQFDLGVGGESLERETLRGVFGLKGDLSDFVAYDVSFVAGELREDLNQFNSRYEDRFAAAIDVVDPDGAGPLGPTCRINVDEAGYLASFNLVDREANTGLPNYQSPLSFQPGECVPLNTFGEGNASAAAVDWVMNDLHTQTRIVQQVFTAALNGNFGAFLALPGGPIGWAGGAEWRRETLTATPERDAQIGVTQAGPVPVTKGAYEVSEAFAELSLPILRDVFLARELTLDWAHRYSDYSSAGSTNTYKFGLTWSPIDDLTFRGTTAEAVRAPNIGELYAPVGTTFQFIVDPCRPDQWALGPDPALRQTNCATLLTTAGVADPSTYADPFAAFTKIGHAGGNPNLGVETAVTQTLGVIYRPGFVDDLTLSVDYYDIDLGNAIQLVAAQDLADQCVDAPSVNNVFCAAITRQVGGGGAGGIVDFEQLPFNVASFTTRGIDFTVAYRLDPTNWGMGDIGTFDFRIVGNNTLELEFVPLPGAATDDDLGESLSSDGTTTNAPEWQVNFDVTWEIGPWTTHYGYNFTNDLLRYENNQYAADPMRVDPRYKYIDGLSVHNVQLRYELNDGVEFYVGANNLGYDPPAATTAYLTDPNGPFYYVGAVATFN